MRQIRKVVLFLIVAIVPTLFVFQLHSAGSKPHQQKKNSAEKKQNTRPLKTPLSQEELSGLKGLTTNIENLKHIGLEGLEFQLQGLEHELSGLEGNLHHLEENLAGLESLNALESLRTLGQELESLGALEGLQNLEQLQNLDIELGNLQQLQSLAVLEQLTDLSNLDVLSEFATLGKVFSNFGEESLLKENELSRVEAMRSLVRQAGVKALPELRGAFYKEENPLVRVRLVKLIAKIKAPAATKLLGQIAQDDPDEKVRKSAITWLGRSGDRQAIDILKKILD